MKNVDTVANELELSLFEVRQELDSVLNDIESHKHKRIHTLRNKSKSLINEFMESTYVQSKQ